MTDDYTKSILIKDKPVTLVITSGHVSTGKSSIMGHVLYSSDYISSH